jgi:hypothetical protein
VAIPILVAFVGFLLFLLYSGVYFVVRSARGLPLDDARPVDPWAITLTAAVCAASVLALWLTTRARRRRQLEVRRWAVAHGWDPDVPASTLVGRWDSAPFDRMAGTATDAMRRADGSATVTSFTYDALHDRHVVMTTRSMLGPMVSLTGEGPASRAAEALRSPDIVVEWVAFNDRWRITSDDPKFAHAVLGPRMMERLMALDAEGMSVLVEGADVVVHAPGRTDFGRIEAMARLVLDIAALLPGFVVQDNPPPPQGLTRREVRNLRAERRRAR